MIQPNQSSFRQIQRELLEAPLFSHTTSDLKVDLGSLCLAKSALEEKIGEGRHLTEDDKTCLREIHSTVDDVYKRMPRSPQNPLYKELRSIRHIANRGFIELGLPKIVQSREAEDMLNMEPLTGKINLIKDSNAIPEAHLKPYQADNSLENKEHFALIDKISKEEIYGKPEFFLTLARGDSKNRHPHTIPYMYNQVGGRKQEDYVNGSLISFGNMAFIATQGPMRTFSKKGTIKYDTVPDFINMLKAGSNTIISLGNSIEGDKEKCAPWWTSELLNTYSGSNRPSIWGERFGLEFRSAKTIDVPENPLKQSLVKRRFTLTHGKHARVVTQYHMENWMDGATPDIGVLETLIRKVMKHPIEGPLVVHCSLGVGRTGTFILAYKNYKQVADSLDAGLKPEDIKVNFVYDTLLLRTQRMKMVATADQYQAAKDVVRRLKSV